MYIQTIKDVMIVSRLLKYIGQNELQNIVTIKIKLKLQLKLK